MPIDLEEAGRSRVEDSIRRAYLNDKQSLAWMVGIIRSSMFSGERLRIVLDQLEPNLVLDDAKKDKMNKLRTELVKQGLL